MVFLCRWLIAIIAIEQGVLVIMVFLCRWLIAIIAIERVDQMPLSTSRQWVIRGRDSEQ